MVKFSRVASLFVGLVVQCAYEGDSSFDPVLLGLVSGDLHWQHEIGRVSSSRQGSCKHAIHK